MTDQKKIQIKYTVIDHEFRLAWGLSFSEVAYLDSVYKLQNNLKHPGWCWAGNKHFEEFLGYTERGIQKIHSRLLEKGLIEERTDPAVRTKLRRTTEVYNAYKRGEQERVKGEQSSGGVKEDPEQGGENPEQSSPLPPNKVPLNPEQSSPYSSKDKSNLIIKEKERRKKSDEKDALSFSADIQQLSNNSIEESVFQSVEKIKALRKKKPADYKAAAAAYYPGGQEPDKGKGIYFSWAMFEQVWKLYPTSGRGSKLEAWKSWHALFGVESKEQAKAAYEEAKAIASHIQRSAQTRQWREGFVPHFSTYLNQRRFDTPVEEQRRATEPTRFTGDQMKTDRELFDKIKN